MAIYQDNLSDVALEEKVNTAVKEVQFLAQQNAVMFEGLEEKITNLKREFAYLSQQNESVYDMTTDFVQEALDKTQANIESKLSDLEGKLKSGLKLSAALENNPYLPRGLTSRLRVGEESGTSGVMLMKAAGNVEEDTRRQIKRLLSMFEPLVIVGLALVVMTVVLAIFMAIMELNSVEI